MKLPSSLINILARSLVWVRAHSVDVALFFIGAVVFVFLLKSPGLFLIYCGFLIFWG